MKARFAMFLLLLTALTGGALADDSKLSPDLRGKSDNSPVDVIVQFKTPPGQRHKDKIANHGGQVTSDLGIVKSFRASVPAARLAALSAFVSFLNSAGGIAHSRFANLARGAFVRSRPSVTYQC